MPLSPAKLQEIESRVGTFAVYDCTSNKGKDIQRGENLPLDVKPAQQMLMRLNVKRVESNDPSVTRNGKPIPQNKNPKVTIKAFDGAGTKLDIEGKRVDRLIKSAKVYVNNDIISSADYLNATKATIKNQDQRTLNALNNRQDMKNGDYHLLNLAVGICHVEEIDLLVTQKLVDGKAVSAPRTGTIKEGDPAVLLLSTPALNFGYGGKLGAQLSNDDRQAFITGMYRNIFHAAQSEGREYIAMPAAGLGVFAGDPKEYFAILGEVAKEFPNLSILYHPGKYPNEFDAELQKPGAPNNLIKLTKDVVFVANELTQAGYSCALHNPSDADVVYGVGDVGEYWKIGKGAGYVGEEHIGATTTAVLNSKLLNPQAYSKVVGHSFTAQKVSRHSADKQEEVELSMPLHTTRVATVENKEPEKDLVITISKARAKEIADFGTKEEHLPMALHSKLALTRADGLRIDEMANGDYKITIPGDEVESFKSRNQQLQGNEIDLATHFQNQNDVNPDLKNDTNPDLIGDIKIAAENYINWMQENAQGTRGITRFKHFLHGASGEKRAQDILNLISSEAQPAEILAAVSDALQASGSANHSFSRYIYDAVVKPPVPSVGSGKDFSEVKEGLIDYIEQSIEIPISRNNNS